MRREEEPIADEGMLVHLDVAPASDSWGFVGRVMIGETEAYRTLRSFPTPSEARDAVQQIVASAIGPLLAGEEWRAVQDTSGHAPLRTDLGFGLSARSQRPSE